MTLPESTLEGLRHIDEDRGKAIVKVTENALRDSSPDDPLVEVVEMAPDTGLIVVGPSRTLSQIPFLHLVKVAPTRFLIALAAGHDYKALELALRDLLDDVPAHDTREHQLLEGLLEHIRTLRRSERVSMAEVMLVRMEPKAKR